VHKFRTGGIRGEYAVITVTAPLIEIRGIPGIIPEIAAPIS